jgi:hypothetical protein
MRASKPEFLPATIHQRGEKIMKTKVSKSLAAVAMAAALVLSLGLGAAARTARSDSDDRGLEGTWSVTVQLQNCQTLAPMGNPFSSYLSFARGGTLTESTSNPGFAAGQRGDGLGIWNHQGHHSYYAKSTAFIFFTTPPNPPANPGFEAGTQTIAQTIKFDEDTDTWTSNAAISFADGSGTTYRQGCAVATGKRFE